MANQVDEYYLLLKGETSGPFTLEQLHDMWMADKITLDTLFVRPGMSKCQPINLILSKVINPEEPEAEAEAADKAAAKEEKESGPWFEIVSIALALCLLIYGFRSLSHPSASPEREHFANVELQLSGIVVRNMNDFDWKDAWVYVNGRPPDGFRYQIKSLPTKESINIPLLNLADTNGLPFNPAIMNVQDVWIGDDIQGYRPFSFKKQF